MIVRERFNNSCDEILVLRVRQGQNITLVQAKAGAGRVWTWTAIDADSKLIIFYTLGVRGADTAHVFMQEVASRINSPIQLTTDGDRVYADGVEDAFGADIDGGLNPEQRIVSF